MRIAINGMLINRGVSGVEHAICSLCCTLARQAREEYLLYMPSYSPRPDVTGRAFRTVRVNIPQSRTFRILWEQFILPHHCRQQRIDLLHAPGYVAPLFAKQPVVITVYDVIALKFPELCKRSNALNYRFQLPRSVRKAAGIIVPSEATRKDLISLFPDTEAKTRIIRLGINDHFKRCNDRNKLNDVRIRYQLPERFILFVGQHEPKKNLPRLVAAYAQLPKELRSNFKLVLAGSRGWGCDAIDRAVAEYDAADDIIFPGFIPDGDLPALFALADLFVFPSLYEGFGLPPVEAMACGTPVVTSDRGSLPEVVGDAAVCVNPEEPAEISTAMREVLENTALRDALITKGLQRAGCFGWPEAAAQVEEFYRDIDR